MNVWIVALIAFLVIFSKDILKIIKAACRNFKENMKSFDADLDEDYVIEDKKEENIENLTKGKTFVHDVKLPIWPFIISLFIVLSVPSMMSIFGVIFVSFVLLNYFVIYILSGKVFLHQLENRKITKNLKTRNFIFRKLLLPSFCISMFFWGFAFDMTMIWTVALLPIIAIGVPVYVKKYLISEYSCKNCGALWSLETSKLNCDNCGSKLEKNDIFNNTYMTNLDNALTKVAVFIKPYVDYAYINVMNFFNKKG